MSHAQLGALMSPGALSRPHASLEGADNCVKCHEPGRKVTATLCLRCHKPVADRIARKKGVHRAVTTDCVTCHVEHMGTDAELRPIDVKRFDHAKEAGFPLDGRHASLAGACQQCHKVRSYLAAKADCASCHADVHKPTLGTACERCHSVAAPFKDSGGTFDHAKAAFPLAGAHQKVACATCHVNRQYTGLKFATCTSCHKDPHESGFGAACTSCHTVESWTTRKVDHSKTRFPLLGLHAAVACTKCHATAATKATLRFDTCAACHADPHKGSFREDCRSCHNEKGFARAPFDHTRTRFPLMDKHAAVPCSGCHTTAALLTGARAPAAARAVDFRGLQPACASCHNDVHQGELGASCERCHGAATFTVGTFTHEGEAAFYAGVHAPVACAGCHRPAAPGTAAPAPANAPFAPAARTPAVATAAGRRPGGKSPVVAAAAPPPPRATERPLLAVRFTGLAKTCVSCHADTHLGQLAGSCDRCHSLAGPKFAVAGFAHDRTRYPLTGRHATVACAACHKKETGSFPAGHGTTSRFTPIDTQCATCHADAHDGQLDAKCDTCHSTAATFALAKYTHRGRAMDRFFVGRHEKATCKACHAPIPGKSGPGGHPVMNYRVEATCTACHDDVHSGQLGTDCIECHKPFEELELLAAAHDARAAAFPAGWRVLSSARSTVE